MPPADSPEQKDELPDSSETVPPLGTSTFTVAIDDVTVLPHLLTKAL
ncbi:hypothetical protein C900_04068 [Fulvivirga imtechensis AK7]|uniref:Uncharacterized protein n=1 Tax=Fulvivirga imtechensis AK7 TaxID=1237149 RepID=L8JMB6_9BACT|nr:hypothetical protein C900_04068 [Fulvivirga imtechensis AK7]